MINFLTSRLENKLHNKQCVQFIFVSFSAGKKDVILFAFLYKICIMRGV
jgi:hypothetical protein